MIDGKISDIDESRLNLLVSTGTQEDKSLAFKEHYPGTGREADTKFLRDVCAFANTCDGDLLVGIEEGKGREKGVARSVKGLSLELSVEQEKLRIFQKIRNCLEPVYSEFEIHFVPLSSAKHVLVVRCFKSSNGPHRTKDVGGFFGRSAAGSIPLAVDELRTAFTEFGTIRNWIKNFRASRIAQIYADETPVPLSFLDRFVVHLIPFSSAIHDSQINLEQAQKIGSERFRPIQVDSWGTVINLDGLLVLNGSRAEKSDGYVQLFRNGALEAVGLISGTPRKVIPGHWLERKVLEHTASYLSGLAELGVHPPFAFALTLLGIRDFAIAVDQLRQYPTTDRRRTDRLILPEVVISKSDQDLARDIRPVFDTLWNHYGATKSPNFDASGKFMSGQ